MEMMVFADTCAVDWPVPGRQDEQKMEFFDKIRKDFGQNAEKCSTLIT